jgi:hypothetical protein
METLLNGASISMCEHVLSAPTSGVMVLSHITPMASQEPATTIPCPNGDDDDDQHHPTTTPTHD